MIMEKIWKIKDPAPKSFIDENPELSEYTAHLLYQRGITTTEEINTFLHPNYQSDVFDPFLFQDMDKAISRIKQAIEKNEKITIHGDYDADGVSGSVILYDTLIALGAQKELVSVFLPHRETDGYGLNMHTVDLLAREHTKLLITVDCGISNGTEIAHANTYGIDVIVTDHHHVPEILPQAHAIIHPSRPNETYPCPHLAGGAVAFKLMQALMIDHKKNHDTLASGHTHEQFEKWLLDMVAISCVADMVPLIGETRTLTKYGLLVMNRTKRIGLQKLLLSARIISESEEKNPEISAESIGYYIAPRINAAGRMNHANTALNLLIETDETQAVQLAEQLEQENNDRKTLSKELVDAAIADIEANQKNNPVLFSAGEGWPTGLVGLIAGRIKEKYYKPSIVMSLGDTVTGSGRSIAQFDMIHALYEMPEFFEKFGGHPMACGFSLKTPTLVDTFKKTLTDTFVHDTKDVDIRPVQDIDLVLPFSACTWDVYDELQKIAPFGTGNPEPIFLAEQVTLIDMKHIGKEQSHLLIFVVENDIPKKYKCIGWRLNDASANAHGINWGATLKTGDTLDILYRVEINEYNGNKELQFVIVDLKKKS